MRFHVFSFVGTSAVPRPTPSYLPYPTLYYTFRGWIALNNVHGNVPSSLTTAQRIASANAKVTTNEAPTQQRRNERTKERTNEGTNEQTNERTKRTNKRTNERRNEAKPTKERQISLAVSFVDKYTLLCTVRMIYLDTVIQ